LTRRHLLISTSLAGSAAALAACGQTVGTNGDGPAAASASAGGPTVRPTAKGKLVLYNDADYVAPGTYTAFASGYPGVEVVKASYASEEEVSAKLRAGGTSQYDNVVVSGTTAAQLNAEGLLQPIRREWLPNLAKV